MKLARLIILSSLICTVGYVFPLYGAPAEKIEAPIKKSPVETEKTKAKKQQAQKPASVSAKKTKAPEPQAKPENIKPKAEKKPVKKSTLVFSSLEQMDELAYLGMPALALRLVTEEQKRWPEYSPDWYAFERKRISMMTALEDWQAIINDVDKILKTAKPGKQINEAISQWFATQQIIARLQLRQPEAALSQIRKLLWSADKNNIDSKPVALWRRLVIRAYLLMQSDNDVQRALRRYKQDYSKDGDGIHNNLNEDWRILQARALLRMNRADEVIPLLEQPETNFAHALRLVAAVRAKPKHAGLYVKEAEEGLKNTKLSRAEVWVYRYVLYEASLLTKNPYEISQALRELLASGNYYSALGEEFRVSGDELWSHYETIGNAEGNRRKMLLGDDEAWYNRAMSIKESKTSTALGVFAVLAFNAQDRQKQALAHKEIVELLSKYPDGLEIVNQLYLHGTRIKSIDSLPIDVRYSLVDYALSKSDTALAARLMQSIKKLPKGQDIFKWRIRKARVLILEGFYDQGEQVLHKSINDLEELKPEQIDLFMQVVFDLQAVQRHKRAIKFIDSLKEEWLNDDLRRELFFWKAESYFALEQYALAAWQYLKSAMVADQAEALLWAQSARFKAANSLVKAGLYDDAETLYTELLRFIASESRKAFIKQELQQIRLLRNAEKTKKKV